MRVRSCFMPNAVHMKPADNESAMPGQQDAWILMNVSLCPFSGGTQQTVSRSCLNEKVARDEHIVQ